MNEWFWEPVSVPPLRADIDRRLRAFRRTQRRAERGARFAMVALLGFTAGALAALPPVPWV